MKKQIKLALLTVALAGSSMGALAQDKATLIKQFLDPVSYTHLTLPTKA